MIFVLAQVVWLTFLAWLATAAICRVLRMRGEDTGIIGVIRRELHPFRWGLAVTDFVFDTILHGPRPVTGVLLALNLLWCWLYGRDQDDDDRWKRRKDAVTGYVREVAGRLTVVPAPAQ